MPNSSDLESTSTSSESEETHFFASDLEKLTDDDIMEAFISVDDRKFPQKAQVLFLRLSEIIEVEPQDIGVEHLLFNPYKELGANLFAIPLDERYTPEALRLKQKLTRLKSTL